MLLQKSGITIQWAAARKRDDAAGDCRGDGRVIEHGEPSAHGL